ncbi:MAG: hypothetical protein HRT81_13305 [Henriciella sp.]|nr:hypothetical protein [Henriciella sp.]
MKRRVTFLALGLASLGLSQAPASAHEQAIAFTEVSIIAPEDDRACTPQICRIEVAHRLVIHDAESTLMSVLGARADLVGDEKAQAKFEAYVADRFHLVDGDTGEPFAVTLLGGEVERGHYWVYQEAPLSAVPIRLDVTQGVLMDAIPQQTNRVNIVRDNETRTLVFSGDPGPQTFSFD